MGGAATRRAAEHVMRRQGLHLRRNAPTTLRNWAAVTLMPTLGSRAKNEFRKKTQGRMVPPRRTEQKREKFLPLNRRNRKTPIAQLDIMRRQELPALYAALGLFKR